MITRAERGTHQQSPQLVEELSRHGVDKPGCVLRRGYQEDRAPVLAVADDHLTLSVPLGAGNMEYFYDIDSIRHIEAAR